MGEQETQVTQREFHIGDVLNITTGRLVSSRHMEGVYDILNFMTGDNLFTHQLPRASDECRPYLVKQHPQLDPGQPEMKAALEQLDAMLNWEGGPEDKKVTVAKWVDDMAEKYGEMLTVKPIPQSAHEVRNPLVELVEMVGPERVIPIVIGK